MPSVALILLDGDIPSLFRVIPIKEPVPLNIRLPVRNTVFRHLLTAVLLGVSTTKGREIPLAQVDREGYVPLETTVYF